MDPKGHIFFLSSSLNMEAVQMRSHRPRVVNIRIARLFMVPSELRGWRDAGRKAPWRSSCSNCSPQGRKLRSEKLVSLAQDRSAESGAELTRRLRWAFPSRPTGRSGGFCQSRFPVPECACLRPRLRTFLHFSGVCPARPSKPSTDTPLRSLCCFSQKNRTPQQPPTLCHLRT